MVRIRLKRIGQRNRPSYRIVVTDSRRSRDGKYLESLGSYNPRTKELKLSQERANYWLSQGAQPSNTAERLLRRYARNAIPASSTESTALGDEHTITTKPEGGKNEDLG